jgi:hypothetical protein
MGSERAVHLLQQLLVELEGIRPGSGGELIDWQRRADLTLRRIVGDERHFIEALSKIWFSPMVYPASPGAEQSAFDGGKQEAAALLKGVIYEHEVLRESPDFASDAATDPELWQHVEHLVEQEQWGQVASQVAIFVESKLRQWAGRPATEVGEKLMTQGARRERRVSARADAGGEAGLASSRDGVCDGASKRRYAPHSEPTRSKAICARSSWCRQPDPYSASVSTVTGSSLSDQTDALR